MDLPMIREGPAVQNAVRSRTPIAHLLLGAALLFAVIAPCAETACSSACCEELAPTQQVTAAIQPALPQQPALVVAPAPPRFPDVAAPQECVASASPVPDPPDHLVSRLRV